MDVIRLAKIEDLEAVNKIYEKIHGEEESKLNVTGWIRGIYPNIEVAKNALIRGDLFVLCEEDKVLASAILNNIQTDDYKYGKWTYGEPMDEAFVIHTLTVDPDIKGRGIGKKFIEFYEKLGFEKGYKFLRLDTNKRNINARAFYKKLGYKEADIIHCDFNGIKGIDLVLLDKKI